MEILLSTAKIQQIKYTFFASLPIEWVKASQMKKGDVVYYIMKESGEVVLTNESPITKKDYEEFK